MTNGGKVGRVRRTASAHGWTRTGGAAIVLPVTGFVRAGWDYAVYRHEASHWYLLNYTPYGILQQALADVPALLLTAGESALYRSFTRPIELLYRQSVLTHEGFATFQQLEVARYENREKVASGMYSELPPLNTMSYRAFAEVIERLQVPKEHRLTAANCLAFLAMGTPHLEDFDRVRPVASVSELYGLLSAHSPDNRLRLIREWALAQGPSEFMRLVLQFYDVENVSVPTSLRSILSVRIVSAEYTEILKAQAIFRGNFVESLHEVFFDLGLSQHAVSVIDEWAAVSIVTPAVGLKFGAASNVMVVPDLRRGPDADYRGYLPPNVWDKANLFYLQYQPEGESEMPLTGYQDAKESEITTLQPGSFRITAHWDHGRHSVIATVKDFDSGLQRLRALRDDQYLFVAASGYDVNRADLMGVDFLSGIRHLVLHVGSFTGLMLTGWRERAEEAGKTFAIFLISHIGEQEQLKTGAPPTRGLFGYFVLRQADRESPIFVWPTSTLAAERYLGSEDVGGALGVNFVTPDGQPSVDDLLLFHGPEPVRALQEVFESGMW